MPVRPGSPQQLTDNASHSDARRPCRTRTVYRAPGRQASSGTGSRCRSQYGPACRGPTGAAGSAGRSGQDRPVACSVLFAAVVATTPARIALERRPGRTRSLMGLGLGFVERLRDLGVGEGLVSVHADTATVQALGEPADSRRSHGSGHRLTTRYCRVDRLVRPSASVGCRCCQNHARDRNLAQLAEHAALIASCRARASGEAWGSSASETAS
jgi:hypothetical protein